LRCSWAVFVLLGLEFAVIGNLANGEDAAGGEISTKSKPFSRAIRIASNGCMTPQLPTIFVNHPDFASSNPFVDADTVRLPEIPLSDKTP